MWFDVTISIAFIWAAFAPKEVGEWLRTVRDSFHETPPQRDKPE